MQSSCEYYAKKRKQLNRPAPRKLCKHCGRVMQIRERDGWQYYQCKCGHTEEA